MSPTQRSIKLLKQRGGIVAIVEKWNSFVKRRIDLWRFGDLIHVQGETVTIVQTTSGSNVSARIAKIRENPSAAYWLQSPNRKVAVHGWSKKGARGKRKLWECREVEIENLSKDNL